MMSTGWAAVLLLALHAGGQGRPEFALDYDAHQVISRDAAGEVRWATRLDGDLGSGPGPHLLWDRERIYVTHGGGVTALDAKTGKILWHAKGPANCMCLDGDQLLAANGPHLVARAAATGATRFDVTLPKKDLNPEPIRAAGGLFIVQGDEDPGGWGDTYLIDRQGQVRFRLDRRVVAGVRQGQDLVLLTSRDVVRLAPGGKVQWAIPLDWGGNAGGGLVAVPGGDLVAFRFCRIADSGVQVARLDPTTGKVAWLARCKNLGVNHSKYRHEATLSVEGDRLRVTSRGSFGTFVEALDLRSGKQLERKRLPRGEGPSP
jgi:outer membrane protein assembly factor BamB